VPPIGALADRVAATGAGWVLSEDDWRSDERMLERIAAILAPGEHLALEAVAIRARNVAMPTLAAMAERTMEIYRRSLRPAGVAVRAPIAAARCPIAAARCLEALHYTPWRPSSPPSTQAEAETASADDALARVARAALRIRHTLPGRLLYNLAPKALINTLKGRLSP
jgi:hypothetical protein